MASSSSTSPLAETYATDSFRLTWANELSFHVAQNVLHLRRLRGYSQARVAAAMGTSQPKVARIEGGDENITLRTLKKMVEALKGRVRFTIEPAEINFPHWPSWWELLSSDIKSECVWKFHGLASRIDGEEHQIVGGWKTQATLRMNAGSAVPSLAEASTTTNDVAQHV